MALLLHEWVGLSPVLIGTLLAVWIAKDLLLYPWLKDALSVDAGSEADKLVGRTGVVETPLEPVGVIRLGAELWRARVGAGASSLPSGTPVRVTAVRGLTLAVEVAARPPTETRQSSR